MAGPATSALNSSTAPCAEFSALSDPIRWSLVEILSGGERCVCDLETATGLAQSRLSYHLSVLRQAGLVESRRDGRWSYYRLEPAALTALSAHVRELVRLCSNSAPAAPEGCGTSDGC